jgi:hypothetical protein
LVAVASHGSLLARDRALLTSLRAVLRRPKAFALWTAAFNALAAASARADDAVIDDESDRAWVEAAAPLLVSHLIASQKRSAYGERRT